MSGAGPGGGDGTGADDAEPASHAARGVALYNAGRYWEAHEALEVAWRAARPPEKDRWQGLILAAAAMLHRERGNRHGLVTQGGLAVRKLEGPPLPGFPVETARFLQDLRRCVEAGGPVPAMELRAKDP